MSDLVQHWIYHSIPYRWQPRCASSSYSAGLQLDGCNYRSHSVDIFITLCVETQSDLVPEGSRLKLRGRGLLVVVFLSHTRESRGKSKDKYFDRSIDKEKKINEERAPQGLELINGEDRAS